MFIATSLKNHKFKAHSGELFKRRGDSNRGVELPLGVVKEGYHNVPLLYNIFNNHNVKIPINIANSKLESVPIK